jgi:2'-5' RNA ligase
MPILRALEAALPALKERAQRAGIPVRWVTPENFHITLKFLGWARSDVEYALRDRVPAALASCRPFALAVQGVGAFPDERRASVLWAGVVHAGTADLGELAARLDRVCAELGFQPEKRPYHAHITLGRIREPAAVADLLEPLRGARFENGQVDDVVLYESISRGGSVYYEERAVLALGSDTDSMIRPC